LVGPPDLSSRRTAGQEVRQPASDSIGASTGSRRMARYSSPPPSNWTRPVAAPMPATPGSGGRVERRADLAIPPRRRPLPGYRDSSVITSHGKRADDHG
jgi:hypothetical protein